VEEISRLSAAADFIARDGVDAATREGGLANILDGLHALIRKSDHREYEFLLVLMLILQGFEHKKYDSFTDDQFYALSNALRVASYVPVVSSDLADIRKHFRSIGLDILRFLYGE